MNLSCMIGPRWSSTTGMSAALIRLQARCTSAFVLVQVSVSVTNRTRTPRRLAFASAVATFWPSAGQPYNQRVAKKDSAVYVAALGGVGEVGKNATLLECRNKLLLIDCGVQFPSAEQLGVDLIIPDFAYVLQRPERFLGLVLT